MKVSKDKVVSINYTLKDDDGEIIDSSVDSAPLEYVHGRNFLLPKLEALIEGHEPGDSFSARLEAKDGYGEYDESLVVDVPRSQFDSTAEIEEGMAFQAESTDGGMLVVVKKVTPDTITVDGNHELAGKALNFSIDVLDVRDATSAELESWLADGMRGECSGECGGNCGSECGGCCGCA